MKTRLAVLAALALGTLAGAGGCADNRASIQVQSICYPTEACATEGGCELVLTGTPYAMGATLRLLLQVENQLPDNADPDVGRLNTNDAHVDEVYIEYLPSLATAVTGTNSWLPANSTGIVSIAIPVPTVTGGAEIVARVRLRGYLDDDTRFETGEFPIVFVTCSGDGCPAATTCPAGAKTCPQGAEAQDPIVCIEEATEPEPTPTPIP
jgi:hypothetical protein